MKTKNFVYTFLLISIFSIHLTSYAQTVTEEWVARYNGPGDSLDFSSAITVDGFGFVYVTGWSYGTGTDLDYATIKYNSNGVQQWVARYNGTGNGVDYARAIAVDNSGNVYVTGRSLGSGTGSDYATIKYDVNGIEQWVARYNGSGNVTDEANAIAVDGSGNVYVTGRSVGSGTGEDYVTIKYNSNGDSVWVARYDGPGNGSDWARAIAVDGAGNVYVTGDSWGNGTSLDYATIKYNSNGVELWVARYNGPASGSDYAYAISVDGTGNVYVTGGSEGNGTGDDYATIKYNSNGVQQWVARYNGPGNGADAATALALDASDNVYVTGYSNGGGSGDDYATIKYNSNGDQQWVTRYNGPGNSWDYASDIAVDGFGNVYVTGDSWGSGTGEDYATVMYNTNGVQQWVARYNGPGNDLDVATAIAVDGSSNVYVTGYSGGSGTGYDYATIKYFHTTSIQNISNEIPDQFSLSQNYPNPFNPTTIIRFDIQKPGFVTLRIYDILGKEVSILVSESLQAGTYEADFNASGLTNGVYFYKLEAGGLNQVKKMVLLK